MPYLSDEIPNFFGLPEEEQNLFKQTIEELGMKFCEDVAEDYYE